MDNKDIKQEEKKNNNAQNNKQSINIAQNNKTPEENTPKKEAVANKDLPKSNIPNNKVEQNSTNNTSIPQQETPQENSTNASTAPVPQAPIFDAEKMAADDKKDVPKPANPTLSQADFSKIFNVSSEENPPANNVVSNTNNKDNNNITTNNNNNNVNTASTSSNKNTTNTNNNASVDNTKKPTKPQTKKQVFNSEERLLYEIKPDKQGSPIVVILFFIALFGCIIALPYISKKVNFNVTRPATPNQPTTDEEEEDIYYFNKSSVRAKIGGLELTNFVKSKKGKEYFLTFNITNTNDKAYQYDKKYYVVFYDGEAVAHRALIHSYDAIGSNAAQEITIPITERGYSKADKFKIEEIPDSRYPDVNLIEKDGDYEILTCTYNEDEIKYYFLENKLAKLKETYTETLESNPNYEKNKAVYEKISQNYKTIDNFNSNFIVTNDYFTMINEFTYKDIADATLANLKVYKFFRYNESKNTVSFELEAQGYTCN